MSGVYSEQSKEAEIKAQNELLKQEYHAKTNNSQSANITGKKAVYQTEMYESLKTANTYLLFFYYFLFIIIHVLFAEQYFRGIKRDEVVDSIWFTIFFIYPAVIYFVETYIYFGIMYVLSFIYGNTYVYNFDKMLLNTSFYVDPNPNTSNSAMPSMGIHVS